MNFSKNGSCAKHTEAKLTNNGNITTDLEEKNKLNEQCQKCNMNKLLIVVQGFINIILIVLVVILFVMLFKLNAKLDERLHPFEKRTTDLNKGPSHGYIRSKNSLESETSTLSPKQNRSKVFSTTQPPKTIMAPTKKFLSQLEVLSELSPEVSKLRDTYDGPLVLCLA